jgi:hypothetical protein
MTDKELDLIESVLCDGWRHLTREEGVALVAEVRRSRAAPPAEECHRSPTFGPCRGEPRHPTVCMWCGGYVAHKE